MDPLRHEEQAAELLRANRPTPDPEFRDGLERRLFAPRRRFRLALPSIPRPALAGAALAGALTILLLAFGLIGGGPLSSDEPVRAGDNCREVTVVRTERVPEVVTGKSGEPQIRYRNKPVQRVVTRCSEKK